MARSAQAGVHGRARRRIVAIGGLFAERFNSPDNDFLISQDKFLALLLRNAAITKEQCQRAIDSYRQHPEDYAWILQFRHTILDKAENTFFVRYGRFPTENADFPVNGNYYQICRTLQYDPHCFDEELKKLTWDVEGRPRVVETPSKVVEMVEQIASKKGNALAFSVVLLISLASATALLLLIANASMPSLLPAVLPAGICWAVLLACGLIATRPRQVETSIVHHLCSECRSQLDSVPLVKCCPNCGVRFDEQRNYRRLNGQMQPMMSPPRRACPRPDRGRGSRNAAERDGFPPSRE